MREKQPRIVVTFFTTAGAMEMEARCLQMGISGKLISAPRHLSSDCGIAFSAPMTEEAAIRALAESGKLEIEGIYRKML